MLDTLSCIIANINKLQAGHEDCEWEAGCLVPVRDFFLTLKYMAAASE